MRIRRRNRFWDRPHTSLACSLFSLLMLALATPVLGKGKPNGGSSGGGTDTGTITMTVTGVVSAFQDCQEKLAVSTTSYLCNKDGFGHTIELGDFFLDLAYDHGVFEDCFTQEPNRVAIGVAIKGDGSAETLMRFWAVDTNGDGVLYVLTVLDARGWVGSFPPTVGNPTYMGELDSNGTGGITWRLGTSNGREAKNACTAEGTFDLKGSDTIQVEFARTQ